MMRISAAMAQKERELISERTKAALRAAKARRATLEQNPNDWSHWGFPWASKSDSPCWLGAEASLHGENPV